jgi:RimJ/RimL family protein N-acetyltransferase
MNGSDEQGFLIGSKITLRGALREDMTVYRRWLDNPIVTEYLEMGWRPTSGAILDETFEALTNAADTSAFVMVEKTSGRAVGTCGLYQIQWVARRAQFNILIGEPDAWNKGLGTEALELLLDYGFERLNLNSIFLGVNAENKGAVRSYEKAGFVHEGCRRQFIYRNGRYYDSLMMSVLQSEYRAAKADHT